jgi:ATP-dependent Clp protease ATP-binding subunit ClpB
VLTDAAKDFIIESAYDPIYGARPLKRFIQSKIETIVAREIIGGNLLPDSEIKIDFKDGCLAIEK